MKFEYRIMIPPEQYPPFESMTDAQAREHFVWFVSQSPQRIGLLERAYSHDCPNSPDLNGERKSLVPLLRWLAKFAAVEKDATKSSAKGRLPEWARAVGIESHSLSIPSLALSIDAGFYLAEMFLKNYSGRVRWILWQEVGDAHHNRPVLTGFGPGPMNPQWILETCMWGVINGRRDDQRLMKIHDVWVAALQRHLL